MKKFMKMKVLGIFAVVALLAGVLSPAVAFAATSADVSITGEPTYIAITGNNSWTINLGTNGDGKMDIATTYYSNPLGCNLSPSDPVVDGECKFTVTNASSNVPLTLTVNILDFTGGDAMANSNSGSGGVGTYGAYVYCTGMIYSSGKVVAQATGSAPLKTNFTDGTLKWGITIATQTDVWTSPTAETTTATITATEYIIP
jgi:hypothetical protein